MNKNLKCDAFFSRFSLFCREIVVCVVVFPHFVLYLQRDLTVLNDDLQKNSSYGRVRCLCGSNSGASGYQH